jgi:hypothetical protein
MWSKRHRVAFQRTQVPRQTKGGACPVREGVEVKRESVFARDRRVDLTSVIWLPGGAPLFPWIRAKWLCSKPHVHSLNRTPRCTNKIRSYEAGFKRQCLSRLRSIPFVFIAVSCLPQLICVHITMSFCHEPFGLQIPPAAEPPSPTKPCYAKRVTI